MKRQYSSFVGGLAPLVRAVFAPLPALLFPLAADATAGITYQGRLVRPNGIPVQSANVQFRLQLRTPGSEDCLLYEELKNVDMTGTLGMFALILNDGTGTRQDSSGYTLDRIFANRGSFTFAPSDCTLTNTYSPNSSDGRKLVVEFNDGSFTGWERLPALDINFVPTALDSLQVGGFKPEHLLRIQDGAGEPQAVTPLSPADFSDLLSIIDGTSAKYMPQSAASGAVLPSSAGPSAPTGGSIW